MSRSGSTRPRRRRRGATVAAVLGVVAALPVVLASASAAATTDVYVDKTASTCSDTGTGASDQPFCTIAQGVGKLQPGGTLYIGDGTYAETVKPLVSGSAGSPVTLTRWPGRSPTIGAGAQYGVYLANRAYVVVSDLRVADTVLDGIYVSGSNHVTVSRAVVSGAGQPRKSATAPGISLRSTTDSTVSGSTSDDNNGHGFLVSGASTRNTLEGNEASGNAEGWQRNANGIDVISPGNVVLRNVLHDNEDSGLQFYTGGDDNLATLNVSYGNGDHGIDDLNVTGGRLIGNTVYRNCTTGINVEGTSGGYTIEDNVAVDNAVYPAYGGISCSRRNGNIGVWDSAPPSTTVDHNLVWLSKAGTPYVFGRSFATLAAMQASTGQEKAGVQADPRFAAAGSGDFRLTSGSPAVDRGDSGVAGAQDRDLLGNPRVDDPSADNGSASGPRRYDDLGAYELQDGSAPGPTAPTAALTVTPTSGTAPLAVTADASASTDPQGQTLTYAFDFGDGTTRAASSAATATHTYPSAGSYTVTVTATDTSGLSATATRTVTATAPTATAPTAALTVTPTSGTAPLAVTADASASTDPQGQTLTYAFDFGDGTTRAASSAATATHTYPSAGSYTVTVTATDTSGLSATATRTVTATAPTATAPTAALTVTPTSGTAPLAVTADASASTDPQGQTLTYAFDFGDGTTRAASSAATATHTYPSAGSYTVTVTATDTSGLSATATRTVTATAAAPAGPATYVSNIATNYSTGAKTSGSITVWRTAGVRAGDLVVLTLQLSGTASGPVTVTDPAGTTYRTAADVSDGSGNRLVLLSGVAAGPLAVNDKIVVAFPSASGGYRLTGDELSGATQVDDSSTATGSGTTFSSGTATAGAAGEAVLAAVALPSGTAAPTWASGWRDLGSAAVGSRYLGRAYQLPGAGAYAATGTASGPWLAAVATFRP